MTRLSRFAAALLAGLTAATALAADTPSVSLTRLDCGTIEVRKLNLFSDTMAYPGREMTLTNSCYLIRHGEDLMLWDAGLPAALIGAPASPDLLAPSLTVDLPAQLAEIGVAPDRIGKLGLSHIHFDHTGQAAAFPQAELLIGAADWAVVSGGPLPPALQGFVMPDTLGPWISGGGKVVPVAGDLDVYGDGTVMILAMPGHTPGETALLVTLAGAGPVLLSGDVVHFEEQLERRGMPAFNADRAASMASLDRMMQIATNLGATLVIQHDARHIGRLPAFPEAAD